MGISRERVSQHWKAIDRKLNIDERLRSEPVAARWRTAPERLDHRRRIRKSFCQFVSDVEAERGLDPIHLDAQATSTSSNHDTDESPLAAPPEQLLRDAVPAASNVSVTDGTRSLVDGDQDRGGPPPGPPQNGQVTIAAPSQAPAAESSAASAPLRTRQPRRVDVPRRLYGSYRVRGPLGRDGKTGSLLADKPASEGEPGIIAVIRPLDGFEPTAARNYLKRLEQSDLTRCPGAGGILEATPSHEVGGPRGRHPYVARRYVVGEPIRSVAPPHDEDSTDRILHLLWLVARALDCAALTSYGHGALHDDNILVTPPADDVTIVDWFIGLARDLAPTTHGGTQRVPLSTKHAAYVPPEEISDRGGSPAGDVYRVGVLAHQLLTGRTPSAYTAAALNATDDAARQWALHGARDPLPGIRRDISDVVMRALAVDPVQRQTIPDLRADFVRLLQVKPCTLVMSSGRNIKISEPQVLIGRHDPETGFVPDVDLGREDPSTGRTVSRRHARLRFINRRWVLTQEPMIANWTAVNNVVLENDQSLRPLDGYPLESGYRIDLGYVTFTFDC
jgi:serine/threonine protein kinase